MTDRGNPGRDRLHAPPSGAPTDPPIALAAEHVAESDVINQAVEYLRPFLRDPTTAVQAVTRIVAVAEKFSGPMPHPMHLRGYKEIVPGSAREILDMA